MKMIPFQVTIPPEERDNMLPHKLSEELPGILNWAIEGCMMWQAQGLGSPEQVKEAVKGYREDMDTVQQFIDELCFMGPNERTPFAQLFKAYEGWCNDYGERPLTSVRFGEALTGKGLLGSKRGGTMFRMGITLVKDV